MSAPQHASDDGSIARSAGGAAARGAILIAVAVVIGLLLLAFALDDPDTVVSGDTADDSGQSDDSSGDDSSDDSSSGDDSSGDATATTAPSTTAAPTTITTLPPSAALPPAEVSVLIANGTGEKGVAGAVSDKVNARGYIALDAANASAPTAESVIFYREGYDGNAIDVAGIIGATPDLIKPVPESGTIGVAQNAIDDGRLDSAQVVVILGSDERIPLG